MSAKLNALVVAVDMARQSDEGLAVAARIADDAGVPLEVLVVEPVDVAHGSAVRELQRRFDGLGASPSTPSSAEVVSSAALGVALVERVAHRDDILLVMAPVTWQYGGEVQLEDPVEHVLAGFDGPVLLLGPSCAFPAATERLVVAVDGHGLAPAAGAAVERWLGTFPATMVSVVEVIPPGPVPLPVPAEERHVRRAVAELAARGVVATGSVLHGLEPHRVLAAHVASLEGSVPVVASPRWAGAPSHWYTTVRRLVHRSWRPVLVVPDDRRDH